MDWDVGGWAGLIVRILWRDRMGHTRMGHPSPPDCTALQHTASVLLRPS